MKLPYGYVLVGEEIVVHEEKADVVCNYRYTQVLSTMSCVDKKDTNL